MEGVSNETSPPPLGSLTYSYIRLENNPTLLDEHPIYRWFYLASMSACLVMGAVGNPLIIVLMTGTKLWRVSYSRFFLALAISDLSAIGVNVFEYLNVICMQTMGRVCVTMNSWGACLLFELVLYSSFSFSPCILMLVALERLCIVRFPFAGPRFWTTRTATITIVSFAALLAGLWSWLFFAIVFNDARICYYDKIHELVILSMIAITIESFLPTSALSVLTSCIIYSIRRSRMNAGQTTTSKSSNQTTIMVVTTCICSQFTGFYNL